MTKDELWKAYVVKNPRFDKPDEMITMPARSLKKFFDQTYQKGYEQGKKFGDFFNDLTKRYK